jgi:hypothetical protein
VDKTHEVFSEKLASARSEHANESRVLGYRTLVLKSTTEERIKFTEEQSTWIGYGAVSQGLFQLDNTIKATLEVMSAAQDRLQKLELEIASLESQLESLLAGGKDVR